MEAQKERPPYVTFELRPIEDRAETMKAGRLVMKDVAYALITPMGSKDRIERVAEDWIKQNFEHADQGRMPPEWARAFQQAYNAFKEGREIPVDGTPIVTWPAITSAQQKCILDANIRTVEDLAVANESALVMIGLGGRMLKQRAEAWLASADTGKVAFELEDLRQKVEDLTHRAETAEENATNLAAQLEAATKVKEEA